MLDVSYYRKTDEIISRYVRDARSLIPIMQDIQAEYRYLPAELLSYVAKQIGITDDMLFTVETVSCLGACGLAPTLMVNEQVHPSMTPEKALALIAELRGKG